METRRKTKALLTCDHLRTLEVLIRMQIAWRESEPKPHEHEQQIHAPPHRIVFSFPLPDCTRSKALGVRVAMGRTVEERARTSGNQSHGGPRHICGTDRSCRAGAGRYPDSVGTPKLAGCLGVGFVRGDSRVVKLSGSDVRQRRPIPGSTPSRLRRGCRERRGKSGARLRLRWEEQGLPEGMA